MSQLEYAPLIVQPNVFYFRAGGTNLFYKSFERKNLHYNRSVFVERIYLIGYSPVSLPRFPSPRKKCVLFEFWASWLALSSGSGTGGVLFLISSSLHLHIHTRHCIMEVGESSFLY